MEDPKGFCVIREEDGTITHMMDARVSQSAGDVILVKDLTFDQAVQTQYALRRGVEKAVNNLVTSGSGYRFLLADTFYAWRPVKLITGEWAWFRRVMRLHFNLRMGDFHESDVRRYAPIGNPITG